MKKFNDKITSLLVFIAVILIWIISSKTVNNRLFLPTPQQTINAVVAMYKAGTLWGNLFASFYRVTVAILITGAISIPLGMGIAWYKPINIVFSPIIRALRYIPVTAFSPILILLVGIDEEMKISFLIIATLFSFLPTVIQTCADDENQKIKETAYTMGYSYSRCIFHVLIPYVMPSLLKSFITLYGVGWTFLIIAETTNTQYGLGHLMYVGSSRGRTDMVFASIFIIIIVSFLFDKIANYIINRAFPWRYRDGK